MKIYNEIILQWNDETQQFDAIGEDSFEYDGLVNLAQKKSKSSDLSNRITDESSTTRITDESYTTRITDEASTKRYSPVKSSGKISWTTDSRDNIKCD